jgi:hypothetical protein
VLDRLRIARWIGFSSANELSFGLVGGELVSINASVEQTILFVVLVKTSVVPIKRPDVSTNAAVVDELRGFMDIQWDARTPGRPDVQTNEIIELNRPPTVGFTFACTLNRLSVRPLPAPSLPESTSGGALCFVTDPHGAGNATLSLL